MEGERGSRPTNYSETAQVEARLRHTDANQNVTRDNGFQNVNKNNGSLKCFYTNADVLRNKMHELESRLTVENNCDKFDIIGIVEVNYKNKKITPEICEFNIFGYDMFHNINHENNNSRGIILYIAKHLNATPVTFKTDFNESVWVTVKLHKNDTLLIGCLYRSPNSNNDNNTKLSHLINEANNLKFTKLLIMEDFNYPHINWELECDESPAGNSLDFIENVKDNFLFQHITQPTRARQRQNPHILDLILTNEENLVQDIEYKSPLGKSDHSVIEFQINCTEEKVREHNPKVMYEKGNYVEMKTELNKIDWDSILSTDNTGIEEQWLKFKSIYHDLISKYIPIKAMCNEKAPNRKENK